MSSKKPVSKTRLNQKSGKQHAYKGYAKIQSSKGIFRMRPTKKS